MRCPWDQKGFQAYLVDHQEQWRDYDASELVQREHCNRFILIDIGTADPYAMALT